MRGSDKINATHISRHPVVFIATCGLLRMKLYVKT